MNPEAQEELDRLLKLNPEDLTSQDRAFMRARRGYMTNDQMRIFKSVLEERTVDPEAEVKPEVVNEPIKEVKNDQLKK